MLTKRTIHRLQVAWRAGAHLLGTPLWLDAPRGRDVCFVSAADVPGAHRHRQLIATEATAKLLPARPSRPVLSAPLGRPFSLGRLRLELFPSGRATGSASLLVELDGFRLVYAGAVAPARAEVRPCDALVIDVTGVHPQRDPLQTAELPGSVRSWVAQVVAADETPVLLCPPLAVGVELVALLGAEYRLHGHRSFVDMVRRLRHLGHFLPSVRPIGKAGKTASGGVVLWPVGPRPPRLARARRALVGGWALDAGPQGSDFHAAFAWSDRAAYSETLEYVRQTGAQEVVLVGASDDELANGFKAHGRTVSRLGPPKQLSLF